MIGALFRRIVWLAAVMGLVLTLSFFLVRTVPGGPFDTDRPMPPAILANLLRAYEMDAPIHEQYVQYLTRAVGHFDLGPSLRYRDYDVTTILSESLPISASLGAFALAFALIFGLTAGIIAALRPRSWLDTLVMGTATLGIAVPNFIVAGLLILVFVFHWQWFPVAGWGSLSHLVLPSVALGLPFAASIARLFRAGLLETLTEDHIRTARAKGLSSLKIITRHATRQALLPVVSYLGPATAGILSGSLVVEKIFAIAGMGSHFVESAFNADYNLALGVIIVYTALVLILNLMVDLLYAVLDPRVEAL
ncbi:MAG: ABC transporter permease subunit [Planctomycetota bacterium]|nr:ABC transporter permease subunit [Planctomycetota bacterium]